MKNYIYLILGAAYFGFYFYNQNNFIFETVKENIIYGEYLLSYFNAIIGIFTSIGIIGIIVKYLEVFLNNLFSKTESKFDDIIGEFIIKFLKVSKYILAIYIGIYLAIIPDSVQDIVNKIFNVSFIFAFLVLLNSLINSIFLNIAQSKKVHGLAKQVFPMISKILVVFVWVIGGITIIGNLGYNIGALITGAGVGGLAIALAAQKSVSNIFGAISVIINKPFKVGDYISVNGYTGVVKDIGLTYLTLRDKTGYKILIPNENIISSAVENQSIRENRRTDFAIGVIYDTTGVKLKKGVEIIEKILEKYKEDGSIASYRVHFDSFGDFSLNITATYFSLLNSDYMEYIKQKEEINFAIKSAFEKAKIEMAFPTQEVIVKKG